MVIEADKVSKGYGDRLLVEDMTFRLPPGGIVGVIGPNGAGKTTLFRMITEEEKPDKGTIRKGETVVLAYVDQSRALDPKKSIWEEISGGEDVLKLGNREVNSRAYVARFNFAGSDQQKKVGNLSGGERNRVHLAKMLKEGANVLLRGLRAGLEVARSARHASILGLEIQCDQEAPTFLSGAYRGPPTLRVKVWRDSAGNPSNLVISTELKPAYRESLGAGIDINQGTTVCGLQYHLDMSNPTKSGMSILEMKDGLLSDREVPMVLYGDSWPQMENVQKFASKLLALQQTLNN